jgi:diguanylate cyclase (GGDEF)-like protein
MSNTLPPVPISKAPGLAEFTVSDLAFELEVTSAILRSLEIDQILYVVLSGVTSGEGLGYNRGLFMLVDDGQRSLRTSMAIGPVHGEEARRIWEDLKAKDLTLGTILSIYDKVRNDPGAHELTHRLGHLHVALKDIEQLATESPAPDEEGQAPIESMVARCLRQGGLIKSSTLELACDVDGDDGQPFCFRNWGMVPLLTPEREVGVLVVDNAFSDRELTSREEYLLVALANLTAIAVEKGRLFSQMRALADVDGLTGVANRRAYDAAASRLVREARQTGRTLSLLIVDIDLFKSFNDIHGHLAGDDVLKSVASTLAAHARKSDVLARYGGEEFVVLLPDTSLQQAEGVARKLVQSVRDMEISDGRLGKVTISVGVAASPQGTGAIDAVSLFAEADRAVYRAKRAGRDRVECAKPGE